MRYAKKWIASHLADPRFLESIQKRSTFEYGDERTASLGGLDWKYLGYPEQFASLQFNMGITDSGKWDVTQVHSASLRQGRSFIIIKLSAAKHLGLFWSPEDLAEIRAVSKDVFVYCDDDN